MERSNKPTGTNLKEESAFLPGTPKVIQWVINHSGGYVAEYVLLGLMALVITFSLFLFFVVGNTKHKPSTLSPKQINQAEQMQQAPIIQPTDN